LITLRPGRTEDAEALAALEAGAVGHPWTVTHYLDSLASHHCWVLEDGGRLVASVIWSLVVDEAELLNIVVDPAYRGRGLGRRLLRHLIANAGTRRIHLEVRESNAPARALYLSQGFRQLGMRKNYYPAESLSAGQREHAILMVYNCQ